jgi:hypothetical protein
MKNKEVAVKQQDDLSNRALAIQADAAERAVALKDLGVEATDLVIPSIQIMQNTSALVGDEKAKLGDIMNMQTEERLGGFDKAALVLPLKLFKTLRTYDVTNNGFKFLHESPLTNQNDKLQGEGLEDGVPVKRFQTFNFFVLLKKDLEDGEGFPCLLRFKSTGMNAGRTLATHLYKQVFFRKKPYSSFVSLGVKKEKKDTNTYGVPVITTKDAPQATAAELEAAESWLAMLAAGNYKIDEREDSHESETGAAAKPVIVDAEVVGTAGGEY